jgi:arabinan endo-1,5-alpha-L-arabinosidase
MTKVSRVRDRMVVLSLVVAGCTANVTTPLPGAGGEPGGTGGGTARATGGVSGGGGGATGSGGQSGAGTSGAGGQTGAGTGGRGGGSSGTGGGPSLGTGGAPPPSGAGGVPPPAGGTGGAPPQGGTGGAPPTTGDRCDVGVYDPAIAPRSLAITNGENVHDPSMIQSGNTLYVFNSGLWTRTSTTMTSWTNIAEVLSPHPTWIAPLVPGVGDLWAPDVSLFGGVYHLYYAASTFNSKRSCIGHATRAAMNTGNWAEDGKPVICSNVDSNANSTVNWNAIDPNVILDQAGTPWLVFGSGWDGIEIVKLTSAGAIDPTSAPTTIATRTAGVLEGAAMVRRCGYYYLFMSWDLCCLGANSTYNIRVGRSTSMTGGFVDKSGVALTKGGGTLLVGAGNGWVGPGGESVLFTGTRAYLVYHAYAATDGHFQLHMSDLYWDATGWPVTTASP